MPDPTTLTDEELVRYADRSDQVTGELAKRLEHAQRARDLLQRVRDSWVPFEYGCDEDEALDAEVTEFLRD